MAERRYLTRSWTFADTSKSRRSRRVRVPEPNTYTSQIDYCKQLYSRLHLDRGEEEKSTAHLPSIGRNYSGLTVSPQSFVRSEPANVGLTRARTLSPRHAWRTPPLSTDEQRTTHDRSSATSSHITINENGERERKHIDPIFLSEHLRLHGFGVPIMLTPATGCSQNRAPPGVKSRKLPKNPSDREKIKGRARLDYEMANMKASAFCEQQTTGKVLRTASANMRNRDVQFVEEELREQVQKGDAILDTDDSDSIVVMPLSRDELLEKVNTWIAGVDEAWGNAAVREERQQ